MAKIVKAPGVNKMNAGNGGSGRWLLFLGLSVVLIVGVLLQKHIQTTLFGSRQYRLVIEGLRDDPEVAGALAREGITNFDAGASAHMSFGGSTGTFSFVVTDTPVSPDAIVAHANMSVFEAAARGQRVSGRAFAVSWTYDDSSDDVSIVAIRCKGKTIYRGNPDRGPGKPRQEAAKERGAHLPP